MCWLDVISQYSQGGVRVKHACMFFVKCFFCFVYCLLVFFVLLFFYSSTISLFVNGHAGS